jgi:histidinol-phosphate aminotransferase
MQEINWGDIPDNTGARLLWGENPIAPKESILAIKNEAKKINLYPSPTKENLKRNLAKYSNVLPENIAVTNGSDDAIELISKVFISEGNEAIIPVPTFPVYESASLMMGAKVIKIALENTFSLDIDKLLNVVTSKTKILWIANPNNPTGNLLLNEKGLEKLSSKINCLLVVDECYFELTNTTAVSLIDKYPNVIIIRSFSKVFGMAGARLGYIIANKEAISYLERLQKANQVFSVNRFALVAANALFTKKDRIQELIRVYTYQKNNFEKLLQGIKNVQIIPTKTTFCLIKLRSKTISSSELKLKLLTKNIYIKDCSIYKRLGSKYVYLGVPPQKYQRLVASSIKKVLKEATL